MFSDRKPADPATYDFQLTTYITDKWSNSSRYNGYCKANNLIPTSNNPVKIGYVVSSNMFLSFVH